MCAVCFGIFDNELGGFLALIPDKRDEFAITEFAPLGIHWYRRKAARDWVVKRRLDPSRFKVRKWPSARHKAPNLLQMIYRY